MRQLRVGEELRHVLSQILGRGELRDPALSGRSITVTEVRSSPDLRRATVYVMPLGGEDSEDVIEALRRAAPYLRRQLGRQVHLKFTPELTFEHDEIWDQAAGIDAVLRRPEVARDLTAKSDGNGET